MNDLVCRGKFYVRKVECVLALLRTDRGLSDSVIAEGLAISPYTVARVRMRFCEGGLVSVLTGRRCPSQKRKLDGGAEASYRHCVQRTPRWINALDTEVARRECGRDGVRTEYLPRESQTDTGRRELWHWKNK